MIYINAMTGNCKHNSFINYVKYKKPKSSGAIEYKIENKIDYNLILNIFDSFNVVINTNGLTNFKMMNTIINIFNNRDDIFK